MSRVKAFKGYAATQPVDIDRLPTDSAFVGKVIGVKVDENQYGQSIIFQLEITEGEYAGFFKKDYEARKNAGGQYDVKYKGIYRLNIPSGDGTERDGWTAQRFNRTMGAFEASNNGFQWRWETDELKGRAIGFVTRTAEFNGNEFTEIGMLISVDSARAGKFKPMKKRGESAPAVAMTPSAAPVQSAWEDTDDDLPF